MRVFGGKTLAKKKNFIFNSPEGASAAKRLPFGPHDNQLQGIMITSMLDGNLLAISATGSVLYYACHTCSTGWSHWDTAK